MEFITFSKEVLQILFDTFPEVEKKCKYCNVKIDENNFGGLFSKPTRMCCDNIVCLSEAITEGE